MSGPETIALPDGTDEEFVHFEIENEKWFIYEVEDDTIIKSKFVLLELIAYGEPDEEGNRLTRIGSHNLTVVFSPPKLRGPKGGRHWNASELAEYITEPNLKFRQTTDGGINEYRTKEGIIQIDHRVSQIDKTSKYQANGMPAYIIRLKISMVASKEEVDLNNSLIS